VSCFKPIDAWRTPSGQVVFYESDGIANTRFSVPCGRCIGCRMQRSSEWAMRCVHEASMHEQNCFITLTYNAEHIPPDGGLRKKHVQDFFKRLRHHIKPTKVKYYYCGEYGDKNNRPHYHILLFGYNFPDWLLLPHKSPSGHDLYTSPQLEKLWGKGFVQIGDVSFESAAYVSRYIMKKVLGRAKEEIDPETGLKPYERINAFTGEIHEVLPEYTCMSRGGKTSRGRPGGIGAEWIARYSSDCYPKDHIHIDGIRRGIPRYYDEQLKKENPDMYDDLKAWRAKQGYDSVDNTTERLQTREKCARAKTSHLERSL
jgi:hypothetical protein